MSKHSLHNKVYKTPICKVYKLRPLTFIANSGTSSYKYIGVNNDATDERGCSNQRESDPFSNDQSIWDDNE